MGEEMPKERGKGEGSQLAAQPLCSTEVSSVKSNLKMASCYTLVTSSFLNKQHFSSKDSKVNYY